MGWMDGWMIKVQKKLPENMYKTAGYKKPLDYTVSLLPIVKVIISPFVCGLQLLVCNFSNKTSQI